MPRALPADLVHPTIPPSLSKYSVPLAEWLKHNPAYNVLAIGGFVLRLSPTASTPTPQLLLILRASTDSYPNVWEPPGGSVDFEDPTVLHGLVREVWEETGLRVKNVVQQIWHADGSDQAGEMKFTGARGDKWCKLNFLVECLTEKEINGEVEVDYKVVLDEEEHQDWAWFTREEMEKIKFMSEEGLGVARSAFVAFEEKLRRDGK